jgi:transketolase
VLTRQKLPVLDMARFPGVFTGVSLGGYVLSDVLPGTRPDVAIVATGSEVHLALDAQKQLAIEGVMARVVSMPCTSLFSMQSDSYRNEVLPSGVPLLVVEAGSSLGWRSYIGPQIDVIGVDTFGASAPGKIVMRQYGFNVKNVCQRVHSLLLHNIEKEACV